MRRSARLLTMVGILVLSIPAGAGRKGTAPEGKAGDRPVYPAARIEPGTFTRTMRAYDEGKDGFFDLRQEVQITRSFEIGSSPVTEALWKKHASAFPASSRHTAWDSNGDGRVDDLGDCALEPKGSARCVSWCDAILFANQLSRADGLEPAYAVPANFNGESCDASQVRLLPTDGWRLPTEAELRLAWSSGKVPSPDASWWEWVWDPYQETPCKDTTPCVDPIGEDRSGKRVALSTKPMPTDRESTEDDRNGYVPSGRGDFLGFRLARTRGQNVQ